MNLRETFMVLALEFERLRLHAQMLGDGFTVPSSREGDQPERNEVDEERQVALWEDLEP